MAEDDHETFATLTTPEGTAAESLELTAKGAAETNGPLPEALAPGDTEGIDWDVQIEVPLPRPAQTILVRFVEAGRRPIALPDDPEE
jgi:hypothetical protein